MMETAIDTLRIFFDTGSQLWQPIILALVLLSIFAMVLLLGWKVNGKDLKYAKEPVLSLKEKQVKKVYKSGKEVVIHNEKI